MPGDTAAPAGVRVLADPALQDTSAAVGRGPAIEAEVRARPRRAKRPAVRAEALAAAALAEAAAAAKLRHLAVSALDQIAATVAVGTAAVSGSGARPGRAAADHRAVDGAVGGGAIRCRRRIDHHLLERQDPRAATARVHEKSDRDPGAAQAERATRARPRSGKHGSYCTQSGRPPTSAAKRGPRRAEPQPGSA